MLLYIGCSWPYRWLLIEGAGVKCARQWQGWLVQFNMFVCYESLIMRLQDMSG